MIATEIEEQLKSIFSDVAGVNPDKLDRETVLRDVDQVDSLDMAEFWASIEDEIEIPMPDHVCVQLKTLGDVVDYVVGQKKSKNG